MLYVKIKAQIFSIFLNIQGLLDLARPQQIDFLFFLNWKMLFLGN